MAEPLVLASAGPFSLVAQCYIRGAGCEGEATVRTNGGFECSVCHRRKRLATLRSEVAEMECYGHAVPGSLRVEIERLQREVDHA